MSRFNIGDNVRFKLHASDNASIDEYPEGNVTKVNGNFVTFVSEGKVEYVAEIQEIELVK